MCKKTLAGQRHTVAWPAGSGGWCARGPWIETRGSQHIIAHPISHQIGFSGSGVRVKNVDMRWRLYVQWFHRTDRCSCWKGTATVRSQVSIVAFQGFETKFVGNICIYFVGKKCQFFFYSNLTKWGTWRRRRILLINLSLHWLYRHCVWRLVKSKKLLIAKSVDTEPNLSIFSRAVVDKRLCRHVIDMKKICWCRHENYFTIYVDINNKTWYPKSS